MVVIEDAESGWVRCAVGCDLELEITSGGVPGVYVVAVDSPAGAAAGRVRLDIDGLLSRRRELAASVLASAVTTRAGLSSALERPVREVGEALFTAVFAERVYGRYTASVQEAARCGAPLRVVLRLRAPELAALPWETLFDSEADEYLCQREPVVRYVETAQPANPVPVDPPLRILGVIAAPRDLPRLDIAEEQRRLTNALADLTRGGRRSWSGRRAAAGRCCSSSCSSALGTWCTSSDTAAPIRPAGAAGWRWKTRPRGRLLWCRPAGSHGCCTHAARCRSWSY